MTLKEHFNIPEDIIYVNTPGNGIPPKHVLAWRQQRDSDFFTAQDFLRDGQSTFVQEGKKDIARFFGAQPSEVFPAPSFTWAFKALINGLPKEAKILLLEEDYPSVNYPIIASGLSYQKITLGSDPEARIYEYLQTHEVDILIYSIVQYITGLQIDFAFLAQLKQEFPKLRIIGDGTQYFGTVPFDFASSPFDAVGCSGYKWLLSGFGNGFMLIKTEFQEHLFADARLQPRPQESFYTDKSIVAIQFETGHLDSLAFGTLVQSILFLEKLGQQRTSEDMQSVLDYAYAQLEKRNLLLPEIQQRKVRSHLINLQIDPAHYEQLLSQGVRCFPRGSGIRIGIHLYNDRQDIDKLLHIVDHLDQH